MKTEKPGEAGQRQLNQVTRREQEGASSPDGAKNLNLLPEETLPPALPSQRQNRQYSSFIDQTQQQEHSKGGAWRVRPGHGLWLTRVQSGDPCISPLPS